MKQKQRKRDEIDAYLWKRAKHKRQRDLRKQTSLVQLYLKGAHLKKYTIKRRVEFMFSI